MRNYEQAEAYLRSAISLRGEEGAAAAHCLPAYALKEQGKPGVEEQSEDCVRFAPGEVGVEQKRVNDAKEQLMKGQINNPS